MPKGGPETAYYPERFTRAGTAFAGDPSWLSEYRRRAIAGFAESGFPSVRDEDWKYTSLSSLAKVPFELSEGPQGDADALERALRDRLARFAFGQEAYTLAFVDGRYFAPVSGFGAEKPAAKPLPSGVIAGSLAAALKSNPMLQSLLSSDEHSLQGVTALNGAFFSDGAYVHVRKGVAATPLIHLLYVSTSSGRLESGARASYLRNLIHLEAGAQARVVESFIALENGVSLTSSVTEIRLEQDASLEHTKLQGESPAAFHLGEVRVRQAKSSSVRSHLLSLGAFLARNEFHASFEGEGGECTLDGIYAARDHQHVDCFTFIDHAVPGCTSRETYKGVLDGSARGVFNGKVLVREHAQKTSAEQHNPNLLLSESAIANTRPQLQIYADDVKCAHGATVGRLDEEAMFYLRSRGIDAKEARSMLTQAFAAEVIERVSVPTVRETARRWFRAWGGAR